MILVDKNIKDLQKNDDTAIFLEGYNEENVNSISYDLTIFCIYDQDGTKNSIYDLKPGEIVYIKSLEKIRIPKNMLGRIAEKNSRMRQGLIVSGPTYQPDHSTFCFLRIQNPTNSVFTIEKGMKIAQIIFETLTDVPERPYSMQQNASFNEEEEYRGVGSYKAEYDKQTKEYIAKKEESIEELSQKIYANVLTIMGIIVGIFSLLTINYQAFATAALTIPYIVVMNITLAICITVMLGIILIFVNHAKSKYFLASYIIVIAILIAILISLLVSS